MTPDTPRHRDELRKGVQLRQERHARWEREGERPVGRNLAMIGVLGWLIVAPTLLGVFVGRWIDTRYGSGIFWTASLLAIGLVVGCLLAWRRLEEP